MTQSYDLAVIGAGPAGMEAAISAAESGVKTVIIDQSPQSGGQYFTALPKPLKPGDETSTEKEGKSLSERVNHLPITKIFNALIWGLFKEENESEWLVALYGGESPKYIRAKNLVLACGTYDTPLAFPGWTLPGVITCGAALLLVKKQRVAPGIHALITGTGPLLLSAAAHLIEAGVQISCICESSHILPRGLRHGFSMLGHTRRMMEGAKYMRSIISSNTPYRTGWSIIEARGKEYVEEAVIAKVDDNGVPVAGSEQALAVDLIVSGYNLTPNTGLARMIGCKMIYNAQKGGWIPVRDSAMQTSQAGVYVVGDGAGIGGAENSRLEGRIAGFSVAVATGHLSAEKADGYIQRLKPELEKQRRFGVLLGDLFSPKSGLNSLPNDETIICRCEEITLGEVKMAVASGARTISDIKMITRSGMGNCQGRICEHSVLGAIVQALADEKPTREQIGYYAIRPPLQPLPQNYLIDR